MKLEIENLVKKYNDKTVLDDIKIDLDLISSLAIIGPSGGGKSTLLRIIAGLEYPDEGNVMIDDEKILFHEGYLREYRKNIGMVFQSYNLFPHLTAMENITLPLVRVHKLDPGEAIEKASKYLSQFRLLAHADKKPPQLSGGQQQRVAIARAVSLESRYILLDEPTSALDPELTSEVLDMVNELPRINKELILVTHEIGFAMNSCDHVVFISDGRIIEEGSTKKVLKDPQTKELKMFLDKILHWH
jgi:polar amino acid transport system ATP-binding protein